MDGSITPQSGEQKKIYILLTKQTDIGSRIFTILSGSKYLHASIGFEERGTFYSFNAKRGFCIEQPSIKRQYVPCMLYSLNVNDEVFSDIETRISGFRDSGKRYGFSHFGMFLAIFRMPLKIPFLFDDSYFCTMFVSELIIKSGAAKLKYKPYRYLPRHFSHEEALELCFEGVWGQPPEFSDCQGDLFSIPVRYAKRYAKKAHKRARVTVKITRRTAMRRVKIASRGLNRARISAFRAPGRLYVICRDNLYTASKATLKALERWWLS